MPALSHLPAWLNSSLTIIVGGTITTFAFPVGFVAMDVLSPAMPIYHRESGTNSPCTVYCTGWQLGCVRPCG